MRTILATFLIFLLILPVSAIGEVQTITHTVKQSFGGSQSPDDARIAAVAKAKREALEMAGVYIEALTIVKDAKVDKDEILALTAGVLQAEVVSQKNYVSGDGFGIEIVVKIIVDQSILEARIKKMLLDKTHIDQLKQTQAREKGLLDKVAKLEKENQQLIGKGKSNNKLKKQFQQASQGLTAIEWYYKATALWDGKKYADPRKAIEYLNKSLRLQPERASFYILRGIAYHNLGQHQRAIQDYNEAIRLQPDESSFYQARGLSYNALGHGQRAIENYDKAIRLNPDYDEAYYQRGNAYGLTNGQYQRAIEDYNDAIRLKPDEAVYCLYRGYAYSELGQYRRAIQDYDEAIRLKPDYALAYSTRGNVYGRRLGQLQRAIEDYNEAIRLQPDEARLYTDRGLAYVVLKQPQRAIEDYNEAIRLQPDSGIAYNNRGTAYFLQGNKNSGCRDVQKACELGTCEELESAKSVGLCR